MAEADVVVCLTDAAAPMARPEAEFVAAAAARVASVVVVLAKKDAFAEWARIQEANREAVAALTDRAIPYLAVSSTLAERVHRGGVPEAMREAVAQSSGLDALRDHLDRFAATGPAALAEAAAAQVLERVAAEIQQNAALRVAALKAPPEELAALNAEVRRQQEALGERNRAAARKISSRTLNRTRLCRHDFDERARQIRADFRRRALEGPLDELESLPDRLRAELAAAAAIAMTAFPDAVAAMAADLEALLPGGVPDADLGSDEPVSFASDLGEPGSASATPGSTMALIGGASMGASIVRLTLGALPLSGALTVVPWIGAALTAAAGVALAWRRLRSQGEAGRRNGVAVWVDRASADVLAEFARTCDRRQMELADLVESTVEQVFSARTAALEQVRLQLAQVTAADQRERPALAAAAQEQAARAERLSAACRGVAALRWDASAMAAGGSAGEGVR
jgi:hypothetical protein